MGSTPFKSLNIRLTEQEAQLVEDFQQRLQVQYGDAVRVTQRTVIVQALKQLAVYIQAEEERRGISPDTSAEERKP